MKTKKIAFYTLGCKVNQYETNAMIQKFIEAGYEIVSFEEKADIYIVNSCTVTNMSDRKSRQVLRRVKQINKEAILVVVGCYAQVGKKELEKICEIDLILGNNEKNDIVKYIEEYVKNKESTTYVSDIMKEKEFLEIGNTTYTDRTRAIIKVQDGCDKYCSYCIIPYARGRVRSRGIENVIKEITDISDMGIKEVVITGIHIASYGKDFKETTSLIDLLEEINKIENIKRIRLGSLEPTIITKEFVARLVKLEKICHHFHLSLQSGCDETLKRMNRKYTVLEFKKCTEILKEAYEDVILTTDIIVGFPGETEEEFNKTYKFLKEINFYKIHVFKYSKRYGTPAASMKDQIDGNIKEMRSNKLIELSNENQSNQNKEYIGKEVEVLFEESDGEFLKGHTDNYILVKVKTEDDKLKEQIIKVKVIDVLEGNLLAIVI